MDFLSKKKFFDKVMHIRRLEEEVLILATEVRQHWDFLKNKEQTLSNLSICTDGKLLDCFFIFSIIFINDNLFMKSF